MGTIFKRQNKVGIVYGINYIDPNGNQIRKIVSPYKETAERILRKVLTEIAEGKYLDIAKKSEKQILFEDFIQKYLDLYVTLQNKDAKNQACKLKRMMDFFKGKYLYEIDNIMIRQYLSQRSRDVKQGTINKDIGTLRCLFNRAIEWNDIEGENPTKGIKKKIENERCRWLTYEEQKRLLSRLSGINYAIVLLALKTGLRWGEISSLKWSQAATSNYIDFDNNVIFIHKLLSKGRSSRYVPLASSVKEVLQRIPKHPNSEYIFFNPETGKPIGSIKKSFRLTVQKAGIRDFRFHDLRHTFASHLVMKGVSLYVVQRLLGHSTMDMTQRYAHLEPKQFKDAIDRLETIENIDGLLEDSVSHKNLSHSTDLAQMKISVIHHENKNLITNLN